MTRSMKDLSRRQLETVMSDASDYGEWRRAAKAHDKLTDMDKWRREEETHLYDHASIRRRLTKLKKLRAAKDPHGVLFTLNEGIHGNLSGMGSNKLYRQAKFGTKNLIKAYIDEVVDALQYLATVRSRAVTFEERLEFFHRADHCFGRAGLMLSGGAALGHFHLGVAKALSEEGILPSVISGASAGAVVAALLGTHSDHELHEFFMPENLVMETKTEVGWFARMFSLSKSRIDVTDLEDTVARLVPDLTFAEAYELTGRQINISIAPAEKHQTSRLLNAITSPNVYVRSAVMASCAIPGVFPPVTLEAKNVHGVRQRYLPSSRWIDGSVADDMPAKRLSRLYGVNYYIASQTNPVVLWFIQDPKARQGLVSTAVNGAFRTYQEWLRATQPMLQKVLRRTPAAELAYQMFFSVATQTYTGDVTIFPRSRVFNPRRLLTPLTEDELMNFILEGQRATYPHIEAIRNSQKISIALDEILADYDRRAIRYAHRSAATRGKAQSAA